MEKKTVKSKKEMERSIIFDNPKLSKVEKIIELYEKRLLTKEELNEYSLILKLHNDNEYTLSQFGECIKLFNFLLYNDNLYQAIDYLVRMLDKNQDSIQFKVFKSGINTFIFKTDKYVLNLGLSRFHYSCPSHYRIAPNCLLREQIVDKKKNVILFIEVQPLYKTTGFDCNDIDDLLYDLVKDGIEPTDYSVITKEPNSFGLLDSYTDCRQVIPNGFGGMTEGNKKYQLSPEFIKKPLVILGTDLLYYDKEKKKEYCYEWYEGLPFDIKRKLDKKKILKKHLS